MTTGDSHIDSPSQHRLSDQVLANTLYAMAKTTFEEGDRPLHRARFKERPQIAFPLPPGGQEMRFTPLAGILAFDGRSEDLGAGGTTGQKCVSSPPADTLDAPPAEARETDTSAP